MFNADLNSHDLVSIAISLICGSVIGLEREYQNKSAGFRTIILICFGATIFTLVSIHSAGHSDRIASNIVTGIGFIGAGVIFKDSLWVKGLTTAAVIWASAAIGMLCGVGHHLLSIILSVVILLVLSLFYRVEQWVDVLHHRKQFNITFINTDLQSLHQLEQNLLMRGLKSRRIRVAKTDTGNLQVVLDISGNKNKIMNINELMVNLPEIQSFQIS
ncbi:MgtC/SapB family protein [Rubrolithibacter danxiaensis]|uniref:MgtC/SapB family protein n=1 Tax=Rubrolithibacter danxiaensis TaxID=3390805 RepID=UPI003BF8A573